MIQLSKPAPHLQISIDSALVSRRSIREFEDKPIPLDAVGHVLFAGQGTVGERRTAPSAGALYPLELYVVSSDGVFHYLPEDHALEVIQTGDFRVDLHAVALRQDAVRDAPLLLVVTAVYARTLRDVVLGMPDDTVVYTGHGPDTTLGVERVENPFLNGMIPLDGREIV